MSTLQDPHAAAPALGHSKSSARPVKVTQDTVTEHFGVTPEEYLELVKDGVLVATRRGKLRESAYADVQRALVEGAGARTRIQRALETLVPNLIEEAFHYIQSARTPKEQARREHEIRRWGREVARCYDATQDDGTPNPQANRARFEIGLELMAASLDLVMNEARDGYILRDPQPLQAAPSVPAQMGANLPPPPPPPPVPPLADGLPAADPSRQRPPPKLNGTCANCGTPIPKRKRHCDKCSPLAAERRRREPEGLMPVQTPTGFLNVKVPQISVDREIVFDIYRHDASRLQMKPDATCGDFVGVLLGLLRDRPEYLTEQDVHRYMALLCQFRQSRVFRRPTDLSQGDARTPVEGLPLERLVSALRNWSLSLQGEGQFPLMESYAMDAAAFAVAHAYGASSDPSFDQCAWRIPHLFPKSVIDATQGESENMYSAQNKRYATERLRDTIVLARVPPRARVTAVHEKTVCLEPGAELVVRVSRCHLSIDWYSPENVDVHDDDEPQIYLARNFRLPGRVVARHEGGTCSPALAPYWSVEYSEELRQAHDTAVGKTMRVPVAWITHVLSPAPDGKGHEWIPVPAWLLGPGSHGAPARPG